MNIEDKQFEDILEKALALQEKGEKREAVLAMAAGHEKELAEVLDFAGELDSVKKAVVPPPALLKKIIAETEPVTIGVKPRYDKQGVGRLLFKNIFINNKFNLMNWKIIAPVGVIVVVLAIFAAWQILPGAEKGELKVAEEIPAAQKEIANQEVLSENSQVAVADDGESIDSIVDSFLADSVSEQAGFADEDADASLLAIDSQEIDNFNQIYDEQEF
jgi:hypothetical protein